MGAASFRGWPLLPRQTGGLRTAGLQRGRSRLLSFELSEEHEPQRRVDGLPPWQPMNRKLRISILVTSHVFAAGVAFVVATTRFQQALQASFADPEVRLGLRLSGFGDSGIEDLESDLALVSSRLPKEMPDVIRLASQLQRGRQDESAMAEAAEACIRLGWSNCTRAGLEAMQKALSE